MKHKGSAAKGPPTASTASDIDALLEALRASGVEVLRPEDVRAYLDAFPDISDVIPIAAAAARRHFPDAHLSLRVYEDPEIDDEYLILCVRPGVYEDSLADRLEEAEAEFLDRLADKRGWIHLTTDFRKADGDL